jgi:hypothetical protein
MISSYKECFQLLEKVNDIKIIQNTTTKNNSPKPLKQYRLLQQNKRLSVKILETDYGYSLNYSNEILKLFETNTIKSIEDYFSAPEDDDFINILLCNINNNYFDFFLNKATFVNYTKLEGELEGKSDIGRIIRVKNNRINISELYDTIVLIIQENLNDYSKTAECCKKIFSIIDIVQNERDHIKYLIPKLILHNHKAINYAFTINQINKCIDTVLEENDLDFTREQLLLTLNDLAIYSENERYNSSSFSFYTPMETFKSMYVQTPELFVAVILAYCCNDFNFADLEKISFWNIRGLRNLLPVKNFSYKDLKQPLIGIEPANLKNCNAYSNACPILVKLYQYYEFDIDKITMFPNVRIALNKELVTLKNKRVLTKPAKK